MTIIIVVLPGMTPPAYSYEYTADPEASVITGHIYRGCLFPNLKGLFFYAEWRGYVKMCIDPIFTTTSTQWPESPEGEQDIGYFREAEALCWRQ